MNQYRLHMHELIYSWKEVFNPIINWTCHVIVTCKWQKKTVFSTAFIYMVQVQNNEMRQVWKIHIKSFFPCTLCSEKFHRFPTTFITWLRQAWRILLHETCIKSMRNSSSICSASMNTIKAFSITLCPKKTYLYGTLIGL